ncbi:uncharacterized protein LOC111280671 [Durio zibethinus]|uniref:Uncharacterized protein LOC111280671 n=1 Tax=Durio zibethinus TaxID=66656 RepID=A0A6P5X5X1_DURZI|nr:uncharacterized protein LOC111280671 [Durio zibethinus]
MALTLPTFMVLRSDEKNEYLGFIHENGKSDGYLEFSEAQAVSPYAKFEVEMAAGAGKDGMVHIRSCQNNKYWVRTKNLSATETPGEGYWITATASKPEEDQSKESCTLFKPISVDPVTNTVRIIHVQSECYLCLWRLINSNPKPGDRCVLAYYKHFDGNSRDIFTIIDWESLLILPKYVAFKGNNGQYLCLRWIEYHPYLTFATDDIGDSTVPCEIFVTHNGNIRIKPTCSEKFWRLSPNWIWADSDDGATTVNIPVDTLFRPVKVDNRTIALINLANNNFCKSITMEGKTNCLKAAVPSVTRDAQLTVEEPVMTRQIHNVKYKLDYSRVYDERIIVAAKNSASNYSQQSSTLDVKLSYTDTKTSTWKTNFSLKLGAKATIDVNLPLIFEGKIELSGEVQSGIEWGETKTITTVVEVVHKVVVPPMTKVTVDLIATNGKCDVPFSFTQRDTLYNGTTVTTEVQGGTYTGSNYYNISFETKEEKLK